MDNDNQTHKSTEAAVKACYSTWADSYHRDYYASSGAYPPVHQDLVRSLLHDAGCQSVLDAGCGPASMLRSLADMKMDLYGFDLTPEMVLEAKSVMARLGYPEENFWAGSVADRAAYRSPAGKDGFDAAVCFGVLPHIPEDLDDVVISNLRDAVAPGGLVALEARNQFFAMFTLNRYSHDFFMKELIRRDELLAEAGEEREKVEQALKDLEPRFRMDMPPIRMGKSGEPGYDEILSRTHNPLLLREKVAAAGFKDVRTLFYHFHCMPPMLESTAPEFFRARSVAMEAAGDWRGYFMASAFVVVGRRP